MKTVITNKNSKEYIGTLDLSIVPYENSIFVFDMSDNGNVFRYTGLVENVIFVVSLSETYAQIELGKMNCICLDST